MTKAIYKEAISLLNQLNLTVDKAISQLEDDKDDDGYGLGQEGYGLG